MKISFLGCESLGVRGLSCLIETKKRKIFIDPGISLGFKRFGKLPHPFQIAVGEKIRAQIIDALKDCTDIVISHYHGDHVPLHDANPFQLGTWHVKQSFNSDPKPNLWCRSSENLSYNMKKRRKNIIKDIEREFLNSEGKNVGILSFSNQVPHGERNRKNKVMMTKIEEKETNTIFVHASDIQLLDSETINLIIEWKPTIVLTSGPPLYLKKLPQKKIKTAWKNALLLAKSVDQLIVDHHLMRSPNALKYLKKLSDEADKKVICGATFMEKKPCLLEAWRDKLYEEMPIPANWHKKFYDGKETTKNYHKWRNWQI